MWRLRRGVWEGIRTRYKAIEERVRLSENHVSDLSKFITL